MAPQFVDYNADGHTDIFTATFDGSPHVSLGSPKGFTTPQRILDAQGQRVMLAQFWNYEDEKWDANSKQPSGHCTSAVVFDWDNDGDLDLLLGSYGDGNLYRQMNEGSPTEAKYTGVNIPLEAGGAPFALDGGVTTPRLVDWDGDGLTDLLCGSYGKKQGGGVYVYRNVGKAGAPRFAAAATLVEPSPQDASGPTRPDSGLYADAVDYDGDGDLDLVVGGYSIWRPEQRKLTEAEEARAAELEAEMEKLQTAMSDAYAKVQKETANASREEQNAAYSRLYEDAAFKKITDGMRETQAELHKLKPAPQREAFVWLYRRTQTSM